MSDSLLEPKITAQNTAQAASFYQDEDIIDLKEIFQLLYKRRVMIISIPCGCPI